jgi:hypothetical protein
VEEDTDRGFPDLRGSRADGRGTGKGESYNEQSIRPPGLDYRKLVIDIQSESDARRRNMESNPEIPANEGDDRGDRGIDRADRDRYDIGIIEVVEKVQPRIVPPPSLTSYRKFLDHGRWCSKGCTSEDDHFFKWKKSYYVHLSELYGIFRHHSKSSKVSFNHFIEHIWASSSGTIQDFL